MAGSYRTVCYLQVTCWLLKDRDSLSATIHPLTEFFSEDAVQRYNICEISICCDESLDAGRVGQKGTLLDFAFTLIVRRFGNKINRFLHFR